MYFMFKVYYPAPNTCCSMVNSLCMNSKGIVNINFVTVKQSLKTLMKRRNIQTHAHCIQYTLTINLLVLC